MACNQRIIASCLLIFISVRQRLTMCITRRHTLGTSLLSTLLLTVLLLFIPI